jgi:hypothetical protein
MNSIALIPAPVKAISGAYAMVCPICGEPCGERSLAEGSCYLCDKARDEAARVDLDASDRAWWAGQNTGGSTDEADADFVEAMTLSPRDFCGLRSAERRFWSVDRMADALAEEAAQLDRIEAGYTDC